MANQDFQNSSAPKIRTRGRYNAIILAVAFFLIFDLGVLVVNFYSSFEITEDAIGINLAGRQRMLSQRTTKALLTINALQKEGQPIETALAEMKFAFTLFDETLGGFRFGKEVRGGDFNPVFLRAAKAGDSEQILTKAVAVWEPYLTLLNKIVADPSTENIESAVEYATIQPTLQQPNNLILLGLMNDLTNELEKSAEQYAARVRLVQSIGITLALLNFGFILFKFIRQLRASDRAVELANEENEEILGSVREGLFLITDQYEIGTQVSQSAHEMFGRPLNQGDNFFALLQPIVNDKVHNDAKEYVELLFSPHVKEALVQSINPLSEVKVTFKNRLGHDEERYLSFKFNAVKEKTGETRHLLVTAQDVTSRIELERRLGEERKRSQKEFTMLLNAIQADPVMLRQFISRADENLLEVNNLLKSLSGQNRHSFKEIIEQIGRLVHAVKGDASALGLNTLSELAHEFETELQRVRSLPTDDPALGDALLALPMPLDDLLSKVGGLKALIAETSQMQMPEMTQMPGQQIPALDATVQRTLENLVQSVAQDEGKQIEVNAHIRGMENLSGTEQVLIREMAVQLARNAIVHGIEAPETRSAEGKDPAGHIDILLEKQNNRWQLVVRDDGAGISADTIRERLLKSGKLSQETLDQMSDQQVIETIFQSGVSTLDTVSIHAGRGVGLDVVAHNATRLPDPRVKLRSRLGHYTEFLIQFAA